jgi:hypothetical protein
MHEWQLTVGSGVNGVGKGGDGNSESLLDLLEDFLVRLRGDERDGYLLARGS